MEGVQQWMPSLGFSILVPGPLLLFVKIIVLDKSLYTHILHKLIVLFVAITGIGDCYVHPN